MPAIKSCKKQEFQCLGYKAFHFVFTQWIDIQYIFMSNNKVFLQYIESSLDTANQQHSGGKNGF